MLKEKLKEEQIVQAIQQHNLFLQNLYGKRLHFYNEDLTGFNFSKLNLQFAEFINCKLDNCKFKNCDLYAASFKGSTGYNIHFQRAICCQTNFKNCNFDTCNFKSAKFSGICYFEGANLTNCSFDDINKILEVNRKD